MTTPTTPVQALARTITADDLWHNEAVMALNAELGLTMDQLLRLAHALAAASPAAPVQAMDAPAVWERLSGQGKARTSPENVADVLAALSQPQPATPVVSDELRAAVEKVALLRAFLSGWKGSEACQRNGMEAQVEEWISGLSALYRLSTTPGAKQ